MTSHYLTHLFSFCTRVKVPFAAKISLRVLAIQLVNAFEAYRVYHERRRLHPDIWRGFVPFKAATRRVDSFVEAIADLSEFPLEEWFWAHGNGNEQTNTDSDEEKDGMAIAEDGQASTVAIPRFRRFEFFSSPLGSSVRCVSQNAGASCTDSSLVCSLMYFSQADQAERTACSEPELSRCVFESSKKWNH